MLSPSQLQILKSKVSNKRIWINSEFQDGGAQILQEFFLMKDKGIYRVGFDEYDERFEDARDLYRKYMRSDFGDLESAVDFVIQNTPITIDDLLRA
jgi:hypothetical protein